LQALEKALGQRVLLVLKDGRAIEGTLSGFDEHMNLVLEGAEEHSEAGKKSLGTLVLRGNHVVSIAPK
jgi:small nuclear ribonucleoprotein